METAVDCHRWTPLTAVWLKQLNHKKKELKRHTVSCCGVFSRVRFCYSAEITDYGVTVCVLVPLVHVCIFHFVHTLHTSYIYCSCTCERKTNRCVLIKWLLMHRWKQDGSVWRGVVELGNAGAQDIYQCGFILSVLCSDLCSLSI